MYRVWGLICILRYVRRISPKSIWWPKNPKKFQTQHFAALMPLELKRKARKKPAPYASKPGPRGKHPKDTVATSAKSAVTSKRDNLTLGDWMTVFGFIDTHPYLGQNDIVAHFKSKVDGALVFTQATLSRKLKDRARLEARVESNPIALSSKRPRVVTRPDVERALILWLRSMEEKRETVNGPMLVEKRKRFEKEFNVPTEECLLGDGWVASFCRTCVLCFGSLLLCSEPRRSYKIKEYRRHGEAGSVDLAAVEAERQRMREVLAPFAKRDRWNFDESGLFAFAPPDRGLATQHLSGKTKSKFRITVGFACNADGSEKMPIFYIGKSKQPRCFKKGSPAERGFYYRNNKKAWMTAELFEECVVHVSQMSDKLADAGIVGGSKCLI